MIIDLRFLVQSIMRFGFLIEVDKMTEKLQGVGISSGSADGAVLTTSKVILMFFVVLRLTEGEACW
ncbi:hypothetical protein MKW98_007837 [Papaver atlanticum]|uniref:Uncharacterized protein n=1 Tax=Papaver atlanticum TaxID=357466 RepID=A0AAD4X5I8_9MAGN|nr:hypothetical protein MKW98_007837 [Papaver atlanticum]